VIPDQSLDSALRDALHTVHAAVEPSSFDTDWAAAQAALKAGQGRRFSAGWIAVAAVLVLSVAVAMRMTAPSALAPDDPPPDVPASVQAGPMLWYTPSDELLRVPSLSYTARPAAVTVYDPIHLELYP
jgi:hypothetical protein